MDNSIHIDYLHSEIGRIASIVYRLEAERNQRELEEAHRAREASEAKRASEKKRTEADAIVRASEAAKKASAARFYQRYHKVMYVSVVVFLVCALLLGPVDEYFATPLQTTIGNQAYTILLTCSVMGLLTTGLLMFCLIGAQNNFRF